MLNFVLAGLLMGGLIGQGSPIPDQTLLLISEEGRLFMGDPGPGWAPEGEEQTSYRQSFYYQASNKDTNLSMILVEADCQTEGKWRIRAGTNFLLEKQGEIKQAGQSIVRRDSGWVVDTPNPEGEKITDHLGWAIWKNTCQGDPSFGSVGSLSPWAVGVLWKQGQAGQDDPVVPKPPTMMVQ